MTLAQTQLYWGCGLISLLSYSNCATSSQRHQAVDFLSGTWCGKAIVSCHWRNDRRGSAELVDISSIRYIVSWREAYISRLDGLTYDVYMHDDCK